MGISPKTHTAGSRTERSSKKTTGKRDAETIAFQPASKSVAFDEAAYERDMANKENGARDPFAIPISPPTSQNPRKRPIQLGTGGETGLESTQRAGPRTKQAKTSAGATTGRGRRAKSTK